MTSLLKVDLIVDGTADQYHSFSSVYLLFSLFSAFAAMEKAFKDTLILNITWGIAKAICIHVCLKKKMAQNSSMQLNGDCSAQSPLVNNVSLLRIHYDTKCKQDKSTQ